MSIPFPWHVVVFNTLIQNYREASCWPLLFLCSVWIPASLTLYLCSISSAMCLHISPFQDSWKFSVAKPLNSSQFTFSILLNWVSWNIWVSLKRKQVIFEQKPYLMKDSTIRELDMGGLDFPSVSPWIWLDWKCRTSGVQQSDEALLRSCNWWDCAHTLIALCKAVKTYQWWQSHHKTSLDQRGSLDVMNDQNV